MFQRIINLFISLFLFFLPIYFLPIGNTLIDSDKQTLLVFSTLLLFLIFTIKVITQRKITFVKTPVDLLLLALLIAFIFSTLFISPNKIESLTNPMGMGTILAATLLFFILTQINFKSQISNLKFLVLSSSLVSLFILIQQFTIDNKQLVISNLSPLGGLLPSFSFLLPIAVYLGADWVMLLRRPSGGDPSGRLPGVAKSCAGRCMVKRLLKGVIFILILSALTFCAFHLATDQKPLFIPFRFGWSIMMETYKNIPNFLLGVGPANFVSAYTLGKPAVLNSTPLWNAVAYSSTNFPLTLATETGIAAVIIFLLIIIKTFLFPQNPNFQKNSIPYFAALLTGLFLQLIFPSNVALFTLTLILLALACPKKETRQFTIDNRQLAIYLIIPLIFIVLFLFFFQGNIYLSDIYYRKALAAVSSQNLFEANNQSVSSVNRNQRSERNLLLASQLSLESAKSLSQGPNASASAQQISSLLQQSVSYARQATTLNPQNSQNYAQLAQVYQTMIGGVKNAEQLALDALSAQMRLDPTSPQPKLAAGGLLLSAGQLDQAYLLFSQAIDLKPDWNNAHYNLANLYLQTKNYQAAVTELQSTLALTPTDSEDYKKVQKDLQTVKSLLPNEATPSTSLGTSPSAGSGQAPSAEATPSAKSQKPSK